MMMHDNFIHRYKQNERKNVEWVNTHFEKIFKLKIERNSCLQEMKHSENKNLFYPKVTKMD